MNGYGARDGVRSLWAVSVGLCASLGSVCLLHCGNASSDGSTQPAGGSAQPAGGSAQQTGGVSGAGTANGGASGNAGKSAGGSAGQSAAGGGPDTTNCGNFSSGDAVCDQCIREQSTCCSSARTCATADDGGTNDAGRTRCQQLLDCVYDCASTPGSNGTPPSYAQCQVTCSSGYNETEYDDANGITACVQALCSQQCSVLK